ncbi:hypothetical protein ACFVWR_07075 [Leifsonia sp. NPDC058292]|uniref:hypothetical protein n=1 Tax=Leifsonia sp. NPDC058292 TaxID=3346428 RepID=UPI0036D9D1AB
MIAEATITEPDGPYPKGQWFTSQDTDAIHGLSEDIRDGVFQFDDALRDHPRGGR